jgi:amino acid adenylation domain-containing protein/non-ribosomal peptide synthase protein (TIGR01720 family)
MMMLDRINALSAEKRRLLVKRLDPLAMVQEPIWFLHRFASGLPAYNIPLALSVSGPLDDAALERTMLTIAGRHEILRTTFPSIDGQPVQLVDPQVTVSLPVVDLGAIAADRVGRIRQRLIDRESRRVFDIERGPLWRCLILRRSASEHVLMFTVHHLIFDGWSRGILLGEFTTCYRAYVSGGSPVLAALPIQYRDFIRWHRARFDAEEFDDQFTYWERQLQGPLPVLELPSDRPRPPQFSYRGADIMFAMTAELTQRLAAVARAEGASLFMVLLAGWTLLLHRYAHQDDIIVGTATSGRTRPDCEHLIGCFINALPLRVSLAGNPTGRELLARVREVALDAYAHQDIPFERLVAELQPERRLDRSPIFTTSLMLLNTPPASAAGSTGVSLRVQEVTVNDGTARFDLALAMMEMPEGLLGPMRYATDLFEAATIRRMLGHLTTLFEGLVAEPDRRISDLPLLTGAERLQLERWNDRERTWAPRSALDLFEEALARAPEAVAIVEGEPNAGTWDSRTLHEHANRMARWLRSQGLGPDARVGLCLTRSRHQLAAVLAVLKAGAAYVPLDPAAPRARLAFQLADAGVTVVLTDREGVDRVSPGSYAIQVVDGEQTPWADLSSAAPGVVVHPEDLAYIIYTSGSTGQPKGVMVTHGGLLNYLCWARETYPLADGRGTLFHSSLAFDLTVTSILAPLAAGGTIRIVADGDQRDQLDELADAFRTATDLGFVKATPAHLHALEAVVAPVEWAGRARAFVVGGEALDAALVNRWLAHAPGTVFFNEYGPTETVVGCSVQRLAAGETHTDPVPIGHPIANTRLYVVSPEGQLAPIGLPGELWIGGAGIARGYVHRPDLTAERFVPDPFGPAAVRGRWAPGGRLYRTGDRVRRRADGALEFLGRFDDQVKLRGHRIEPGEIEAALRRQPDVRDAVVVLRQDVPGTSRLVGYVVRAAGDRPRSVELLQQSLRAQLPEYMVPSTIVWLDVLPLTANGKVDRRRLGAPDDHRPAMTQDFVAPRTPVEATLARIWAEVLQQERVGIHDNFFALGGDSIVSLQIVTRALQAGLRIAPRQVFAHQTIAALAPMIDPEVADARAEPLPLTGRVPMLPMQRRFFSRSRPAPHHYNQQARLALPPEVPPAQFARAWDAVLRHHDALRFRFVQDADGWMQTSIGDAGPLEDQTATARSTTSGATKGARPAQAVKTDRPASGDDHFPTVDLRGVATADQPRVQQQVASAVQGSLNLAASPTRVVLLQVPGASLHAFFVIHHLVVDGVSWRVLLMDLQAALQQVVTGQPMALPPRSSSVGEWADALQALASSGALAGETALWTEMTASAPPVPRDTSEGQHTVRTARGHAVALSEDETRAILQELPGRGVGHVQELLLTALVETLAEWTGQPTWRIDLEGHGREELPGVDVSRTVGWLTSVYPVRLAGAADPLDTLRGVKTRLRTIPRYGLGYGVLRYLDDRPETAAVRATAPADIIFNYLGQTAQVLAPGRGLRPGAGPVGRAVHPDQPREYVFEITGIVVDDRLRLSWVYGAQLHRADTIERLTASFMDRVRALIAASRAAQAERRWLVPADFPLADLDAPELETLARRGAIADVYPLSPMQEGLLFHCVYERDPSLLYTVRYRAQLDGPLDPEAFQRAWQTVVSRHDMLRTGFLWNRAGRPLQVVYRTVEVPCAIDDWRDLAPADRQTRLNARLADDDRTGFNLERAPLMRIGLVRLEDERWHAAWTLHHLITDGWSVQLVMAEVLATYNALVSGQPAAAGLSSAGPAARYREYIAWLQRQDLSRAEVFWRRTLDGVIAPSLMAGEARSRAHGTTATRTMHGAVPRARLTQLQAFGRAQALTMNTCLMGAWALVLAQQTGGRDVVFGTVVSGRPPHLRDVERTPGMFVNTLPLRASITPGEALAPWLHALQTQQTDAREYEYTPLSHIQRWTAVPPELPLFDTLVAYENYPVSPSRQEAGTGVRVRRSDSDLVIPTSYPLVLELAPSSDAIGIRMTFDRARVPDSLAHELLDRYQRLIERMAAAPETTLGALIDMLATCEADAQAEARELAQRQQQSRLRARRRDVQPQ